MPHVMDGNEKLGRPVLRLGQSSFAAFTQEALLSAFLIFMFLSVRINESRRYSIVIALGMVLANLLSFPVTGGSLNPSRFFGPASLVENWSLFSVYFVAPCIGSVLAAALFAIFRHADIAA